MVALHIGIGAIAIAVASVSITLLTTSADHDLLRSAAMIGMMISTGAALYVLIDWRMSRVERITSRVVAVEQDVLLAVRDDRARLN